MCLSPIQIYNPSKYINLHHGDPFKLVVPCNHCAECVKVQKDVWHFRMAQEFKHYVNNGWYVLFDTLTYKRDERPMLSHFIDTDVDYPCFNRDHIRKFLVRLRRRLSYRNYPNIRYFLTSEYGTDPKRDHAPHYHILVFAHDIPSLELAKHIYLSWQHGRTDVYSNYLDGFGMRYVNERVFDDYSLHGMRLANYVAKYVMKDSEFQRVINARIEDVVSHKFPDGSYCSKSEAHSYRIKVRNLIGQFHLQSQGFGLKFLESQEFNLDEVFESGMIQMVVPDNPNIYHHIPIPMYYQRHLFYRLFEVDGKRFWELNDDGVRFRKHSMVRKHDNFVRHISDWLLNVSSNFDSKVASIVHDTFEGVDLHSLADYVLFLRGRFLSSVDYAPLSERILDCQFYHYGSSNDAIIYDKKFVTSSWLGNDVLGYDPIPEHVYSRSHFASSYTYMDSHLEFVYQTYLRCCQSLTYKQESFDLIQRLEKLYKDMFARV